MAVLHLHEAGIDAVGEGGVLLDHRAVLQHGEVLDVVHHLHRVRVAHRHGRNPCGAAVDLQAVDRIHAFSPGRQALGAERHLGRFQLGRAHVHGDLAVVLQRQRDHALHHLHAHRALVGHALVADETHEAARAVAAVLDLAAVGIEDAVAEVDIAARRFLDHQHLVGAHAEMPAGERAPLCGCQVDLLVDAVEHDKVVAGAMHLGELEFHGGDCSRGSRKLLPPSAAAQ
ncbi:hypothetical protein D9M68_782370 [compost metagenome]